MSEINILTGQLQLVPALVGGFILVIGLCSLVTKERLYLSETLLATVYGVIVGPRVLNWIDPTGWSEDTMQLTQEYSRYALAIEVMIAGVCLPKKYVVKEWISLLMLLVPVMSAMWLISSAIVKFLFDLSFLHALAIGACVAPTDPVLANAILKGVFAESHVPLRLRNILTAESGANDGFGYPFLFFAIYLMRFDAGEALGAWFYATWAYEILLSVVIGILAGYVARKALKFAENARWVDRESFLSSSVTLSLFLVGICTILGTDDILCCFVAGNSFTWDDWFRVEIEDTGLQEALNGMLSMTFFLYFGAIMPWSDYTSENVLHPWRIVLVILLVLLLRRLPVLMLSYKLIPAVRTWQDALFAGWFGPMGVSAVFYAVETIKQIDEHDDLRASRVRKIVFPVVCAIVFGSVIIHGITIPLVLMGRRMGTTLAWTQSYRVPFRTSFRTWSRRNQSNSNDADNESQKSSEISAPDPVLVQV
ncbi:hypothetical protein LPJ78_000472 [Coemansia sp. RSA 989]|nr:putative Na/H antiporter [Coemansia mojavensis]KAJ1738587.1 hypothetical protein LPJ68_005433 [Coemansia sp. RSA 1086]KAJ1747045.1 hypothetical protein LPJ79_005534 [Coemansia sp. RSA 1821]KAJ1867975.1 hypothetical protein LPJ78_000472 [Coemansia sp. RSA 989]KAJ1869100.1 hypothetical protein LPJ55_005601 [Coemansia sp. RSA 990]KAJ2674313.1 hypothetical protein IWW42_001813 [Coemansia sp. RSA 1085]